MATCAPTLLRGDDEVEQIPPALFNGVGVVGLLALAYWMLATGRLYTGASHREAMDAKNEQIAEVKANADQRIADKDTQVVMWKAAFETKDAQGTELLEHSRLSVQLLQAIEKRAQEQAAKQTES